MSRLRRTASDEGFTLVEVMVALIIFALVITSTTALITSALKGLLVGRADTLGKNLTQEGMEKIRNLPFFVSATVAGGSPDVFDSYYWKTTNVASTTSATGFVGNGVTATRDTAKGDPTDGPFYRTVVTSVPGDARYASYGQRITVQLLSEDGAVVTSPVFDSTSTGAAGKQPSTLLGVTVTTLWNAGGKARKFSTYSRIADSDMRPPIVTLQARLAAVRVSGLLSSSRELLAEAGVVNLDGSLSSSTVASASALGARSSIADGLSYTGASTGTSAPPSGTAAAVTQNSQSLDDSGLPVAQYGNTKVESVGANIDAGQPTAGTSALPVTSTMFGAGFGINAFTADIRPDTTSRLRLTTTPMVRLEAPSCGGSCAAVRGTGYLASVGGGAHSATASTTASTTGTFKLLPTTFAPEGLLQVTFATGTLTCASSAGSSPAASVAATYSGTVSYFRKDASGVYGYSAPVAFGLTATTPATTADPLLGIPLATTQVGVDATNAPLYLGDYVQGWSTLTRAALTSATKLGTAGTTSSVVLPGFFTLATKPLRSEAESTIGLQLGSGTCTAGDLR